jgi:CBS domain-containing protein
MIFFDFRSVVGSGTLSRALRSHVEMRVHRHPIFLKYFARYFLLNEPPLSFYDSQLVEKDGARTDLLDIKTRTLTPFVDFARIMALSRGISETNTLGRLRALAENGYLPGDLYDQACRAYEYDLHLCFVHQLRTIESGENPVNYVHPGELSELEKKTLKFSFSVIERLMEFVRERLDVASSSRPPSGGKP